LEELEPGRTTVSVNKTMLVASCYSRVMALLPRSWPVVVARCSGDVVWCAARGRRGAGCFFCIDGRWCVGFLASGVAEMLTVSHVS
jgi:hypothetical protein